MKCQRILRLIPLLLALAASGRAQVYSSGGPVVNNAGQAIAANLAVCTTPPTIPVPPAAPPNCGSYVATYTDATQLTPCTISATTLGPISGAGCTNPGKTDSRGNYTIFANPAVAYVEIYGYAITTYIQPITISPTSGTFPTVFASTFPGADWCAQVMAADASLGAGPGEIWINNAVSTMTTCSADLAIRANHGLKFVQGGTYTLGAHSIVPAGPQTSIYCDSWGTVLSYSGANWAYDIVTQQRQVLEGCQIQIAPTSAGGIRIQHETSNNEANHRIRRVLITNSTHHTYGQIGVQLLTQSVGASNYHSDIDVQTLGVDIGLQLRSTVSDNGSNGNRLNVNCNLHSICIDWQDGTDEVVSGIVLGSYAPIIPTITASTTGATIYRYEIVFTDASGTHGSWQAAVVNGAATADNTINWTAPAGFTPISYLVYCNEGCPVLGKIATVTPPTTTFHDTGLSGDGAAPVPAGIAVNLAGAGGGGYGDFTSVISHMVSEQGPPSIGFWQHSQGLSGSGIILGDTFFNESMINRDDGGNVGKFFYFTNSFTGPVNTYATLQVVGAQNLLLNSNVNFGPSMCWNNVTNSIKWCSGIGGSPGSTVFNISDSTHAVSPFIMSANAPTNSFFMQSTGKVQFGGNSPNEVVDVVGAVTSTGGYKVGGVSMISGAGVIDAGKLGATSATAPLSALPGSGVTTVNGTACTLGASCTPAPTVSGTPTAGAGVCWKTASQLGTCTAGTWPNCTTCN